MTAPSRAVVIGGSAGSVASLLAILRALPTTFRAPVFLTVHVPPHDRRSVLVDVLKTHCALTVAEAQDKEPVRQGALYIAPANYHLLVEDTGTMALSSDEPVLYSRPSIDVLFESAADAYGDGLACVVLSGANHDGARGAKAIEDAGGMVLVEDPAFAYAPVMPRAALQACSGARAASPEQIATYLSHW